ncbi:MAG: GntR family transcriptional regulator [Motiliproteus sp.]
MATEESPTYFLPLYAQVKQLLVQRLIDNVWTPGMGLPSENQLAAELKVSQGTVRKALDEMAAERLVVRRQGRGTFVAEHTQEQALFHFFRLVGLDDQRNIPESEVLSAEDVAANALEMQRLGLNAGDLVTRIVRLRKLDDRPVIYEVLSVPLILFPNIAEKQPFPNSLYSLYQRDYGLSVLKSVERVKAVSATAEEVEHLNVEAGTPLLEIERTASALSGRAIELRVSRCNTEHHRYMVELT